MKVVAGDDVVLNDDLTLSTGGKIGMGARGEVQTVGKGKDEQELAVVLFEHGARVFVDVARLDVHPSKRSPAQCGTCIWDPNTGKRLSTCRGCYEKEIAHPAVVHVLFAEVSDQYGTSEPVGVYSSPSAADTFSKGLKTRSYVKQFVLNSPPQVRK